MELDFVKLSPTENMTVLIKSRVPREKQAEIGSEIIKYNSVYAEQAGFIEKSSNPNAYAGLQMAGGEFCGNGTMAAASYIAHEKGIRRGETMNIPLEVSGADGILNCKVEALEHGFKGTVLMPSPLGIYNETYLIGGNEYTLPTVVLPGIRHIILPVEYIGNNFKEIIENEENVLKSQISDDAFGIIVFDENNMRIHPFVVVKSIGSSCWERGCGSGSEAVGYYLCNKYKKDVRILLKQPGGEIEVDANFISGEIYITGTVYIVSEGKAYLNC